MISIEKNTDNDFVKIIEIANEVWPIAYGTILSETQLDFMMEMMYSIDSLQLQANSKNHQFILAKENGVGIKRVVRSLLLTWIVPSSKIQTN